jgi:predicted methyltransferase
MLFPNYTKTLEHIIDKITVIKELYKLVNDDSERMTGIINTRKKKEDTIISYISAKKIKFDDLDKEFIQDNQLFDLIYQYVFQS